MKNKYTKLQKYIFKLYTSLGYKFFHKQEIILIPKYSEYNTHASILYNETRTFTKEELCLILEKYFCCDHLLSIAPLTKYLHLNFIFLKPKDENYYKIKINYIFASPKIQKLFLFDINNYYKKEEKIINSSCRIKSIFGHSDFPIWKKRYTSSAIKVTFIKKIKKNKFLHLIKQTKFQRTHQFFNFLKHIKKGFSVWNEISKFNYPQSVKSAITYYGFTNINNETYEDIIENFDYPEPKEFDTNIKCLHTLKTLTLNLFEIFKINNDFDLFYFLFYNYMLYTNIYIDNNNQLIQIMQTDKNKENFLLSIKKFCHNIPDFYNFILIPGIPIQEQTLGDLDWFFTNLHTILDIMCKTLNLYLDKDNILNKFSTIFYKGQIENLKSYLKIRNLPTKDTILTKREYHPNSVVFNWTTCMVVYLLKSNNLHTHLPKTYTDKYFFEIDLENLLKYTNIYAENLDYKPHVDIFVHETTLESREIGVTVK